MDEFLEKMLDELESSIKQEKNDSEADPDQEEETDMSSEILSGLTEHITIAPEFYKIVEDFIDDIQLTFPEYIPIIKKWWNKDAEGEEKDEQCKFVFNHCLKVLPVKMFDVLQQNAEMFNSDDTEFLPNIIFKNLWNSEITENTRKAIWKYLQSLISVITSSVKIDGFEKNILHHFSPDEMTSKIKETMNNVNQLFGGTASEKTEEEKKDIQDHFQEMTKGKIGKLAFELAEETAKSLNLDDATTAQDAFANLMKNPSKLMGIVQNMGNKLDEKMKQGDIDESEIMKEGMDMLSKMKDIPGFGDLSKMFGNFNMPDLNNAQKGAYDTKIKQNAKLAKMKERMNRKRKGRDPELAKIEDIKKMLES